MLTKDFKAFIALLNSNEVKCLVVGGYALAMHGHTRYTGDVDIWLDTDEINIARPHFAQCPRQIWLWQFWSNKLALLAMK